MSLTVRFFKWHRWLGYAVALQVLAWVLGGLLFAWLPFKGWVKGQDAVQQPSQALPQDWAQRLAGSGVHEPVRALRSVATANGPAFKLSMASGERWLSAAGGELAAADEASVAAFARSLYRADGALLDVKRLAGAGTRLGIVRELGGQRDVWLARFDDGLKTRLYFHGRSGELLAVRTDAWVVYDFFWRLHVMDYADGEDFNNLLLRAASPLALGLVLTGAVMLVLALRRAARRRLSRR